MFYGEGPNWAVFVFSFLTSFVRFWVNGNMSQLSQICLEKSKKLEMDHLCFFSGLWLDRYEMYSVFLTEGPGKVER